MENTENNKQDNIIGFGDTEFTLAVYIANQPAMPEYHALNSLNPLQNGDITSINDECGNGWRKVFNVYAKLLYALDTKYFKFSKSAPTWQQYRDHYLLQVKSGLALIFSPPQFPSLTNKQATELSARASVMPIHIICGRTYAKHLIHEFLIDIKLVWLDDEFAIDLQQRVIVCPYFDYRQLSDKKIQRLSMMLNGVLTGEITDLN